MPFRWIAGSLGLLLTVSAAAQESRPETPGVPEDPRYGLLNAPSEEELAFRARARQYEKQIRVIRRKCLGKMRVKEIREQGIEQLREFIDPASFRPLIEELAGEDSDVRLAILDHFAAHDEEGQAALAYVAIMDEDDAMRHEAVLRMVTPASVPVLRVLDMALRSNKHVIANNSGALAGALGALETIPLLIFAQATGDPVPQEQGDLAWIAIQTQRAYVADLQPVVGGNSGAFQPILGRVSEGVVLRIRDAVVVVYRTEIHRSLVAMTSHDWGRSTGHLGYDMKKWWTWYNSEYVPYKNEQARRAAREKGVGEGGEGANKPGAPPSR